jgi:hypothetical protein
MQDGQRVNRITVLIGEDSATISLYRTNQKLGEVSTDDLGIPPFDDSGLPNKNIYMCYCRDFMINLLEHGGVEGFYYEPKQETDEDINKPRRFDTGVFSTTATALVSDMLTTMFEDTQIKLRTCSYGQVDVKERYADKFIRYGTVSVVCQITENEHPFNVIINVDLKSGQLCKPKVMTYNGEECKLNITTIKSIIRSLS